MLIPRAVLDRIVAGEVDTVFRRQKRPTVKTGGTLRTQVGVLDIVSVEAIALGDITDRDARRAGYARAAEVVEFLTARAEGADYRVRVALGGADPRVALRADDDLTRADVAGITARLDRFDASGRRGAWTHSILTLIAGRPHVRASDLAAEAGWETASFKTNVRKLNELGLTISHSPGYELSPRGRAYLAARADVRDAR